MATRIVKSADLAALDVTLRTAFMDSYNNPAYAPRYPKIASTQPSASKANLYPLMLDAAGVREWNEGERKVNGIVLDGYRVVNGRFELTYSVQRTDLDDDMTQTVAMAISRLRSAGTKYVKHTDYLLFNVLKLGSTTALCLDGLPLFSASHKINPADAGSSTFANTASGQLTANNLAAAKAKMLELTTPDGYPANTDVTTLIVPPALEQTARKITQADVIVYNGLGAASGDTTSPAQEGNIYKGTMEVIVAPQLSAAQGGSDSTWYLCDSSDPDDRAAVYQVREAVEIVTRFNPSDPGVFDLDAYTWGTRARFAVAGGNPKKIFQRTG